MSGGTSFCDLDEVVEGFAVCGRELAGVQVDAGIGKGLLYGCKERRQLGSRAHRRHEQAKQEREKEKVSPFLALYALGAI